MLNRARSAAILLAFPLALCACAPAGQFDGPMPDFTPSRSGATFRLGQTAKVITRDFGHGVPVYWDITVGEPTRTQAPRSAKHAAEFVCFPVTATPVAIGAFPGDVTVALPELSLIDGPVNPKATLKANKADPAYCGETTLTGYTGDLRVGETYTTYAASWRGSADPGIVGTGVRLQTADTTLTWR